MNTAMMKRSATLGLQVAAFIAVAGALIHGAAIAGGPAWFEFFGAPPAVPAWYRPELINSFELVASAVWGAAGLGFALGWLELGKRRRIAPR
jgi:hypothetical protein